MEQFAWAFWLILSIVLALIEAATVGLVAVWFALGALIAVIPALLHLPLWVQLLVFVLVSTVSLAFTRKFVTKVLKMRPVKTNVDRIIGETGTVIEEINNLKQTGRVRVSDVDWIARSSDPSITISVNTQVCIKKIEGVKLIVEPIGQ